VDRHLADTEERIVALLELPLVPPDDGPAIACTLATSQRVEQADRWRSMLTAVTGRSAIPDGVRLSFDPGRVRLAELAAAQSRCCRFFEISLQLTDPVTMDVRAPAGALVLVHELFGEPDA
jgi:alkylhydroperoxidase family enzyme